MLVHQRVTITMMTSPAGLLAPSIFTGWTVSAVEKWATTWSQVVTTRRRRDPMQSDGSVDVKLKWTALHSHGISHACLSTPGSYRCTSGHVVMVPQMLDILGMRHCANDSALNFNWENSEDVIHCHPLFRLAGPSLEDAGANFKDFKGTSEELGSWLDVKQGWKGPPTRTRRRMARERRGASYPGTV